MGGKCIDFRQRESLLIFFTIEMLVHFALSFATRWHSKYTYMNLLLLLHIYWFLSNFILFLVRFAVRTIAHIFVSFAWNTRFPVRGADDEKRKFKQTENSQYMDNVRCVVSYGGGTEHSWNNDACVPVCMLACARDSLRELVWLSIGLNRLRYGHFYGSAFERARTHCVHIEA